MDPAPYPLRGPFALTFLAILAMHVVLLGADATPWDSITKCLLAPVLVAWALTAGRPLLAVALALCLGGDLLLELDGLFVAGMASFAAAHVAFVTLFVRAGALRERRPAHGLVLLYLAAAVGVVVWAWGGLEPDLRPIVPVYAALLLATAVTSAAADRLAGVGGALFLVSDGIIALGEAGRVDPASAPVSVTIMVLYGAAILLLTVGALRLPAPSAATPSAAPAATNS